MRRHPPGGRDTGHAIAMSEAGWVNLYDLMPYRWAGELFNGPSELVSTLVLPNGREKVRAQVAVVWDPEQNVPIRPALARAITGHSIGAVRPDMASVPLTPRALGFCVAFFHRTTRESMVQVFKSGFLAPGADLKPE